MGKLFGTFGVRGIVGEEVTPDLAYNLGLALATHLNGEGKVAVGYDTRTSNVMLEHAIVSGLTAGGCDATRLGMVPTPVLSFGIKHFSCDAGIVITASHNPPEYNGFKFWDEEGAGFVREREREIEELFEKGGELKNWDEFGRAVKADALSPYLDSLADRVPEIDQELKVVVDCANGAGSVATPEILSRLGCKVIAMNSQPDGSFPGRLPEPTPEHIQELVKTVKSTDADLGIAHDGDGDRTIIVDESGEILSGDRVFALVALHYLRGMENPRIITTVATSSVLDDVAEQLGGEVVRTRVGEPDIISEYRENDGDLGGEENGGVIFPDWLLCRDGVMTAIQFVEYISQTGEKVSEVNKTLPEYHQFKKKTDCPDKLKPKVLDDLAKKFEHYNPDRTDGVRVVLEDGWFIVRPSGTEPIFRCFSEAQTEERAEELVEEGMQALEESISKLK
ncbi:hypothetical protein AKJ48_00195 [candidate division MSBL1 archaeon SCGC-AAA261O19]|uniref:Phosphoglucosamine mutase n=1 Tax=candidate division MSBL1 archaeon SCGC-AAA261O19 TaxID=1698277 RepID=A0A133VF98_9EURY|nr:hypothetical protein AKJ48_00195 [candidate division MSBL1 archaeon SCGC-AAA261O19]